MAESRELDLDIETRPAQLGCHHQADGIEQSGGPGVKDDDGLPRVPRLLQELARVFHAGAFQRLGAGIRRSGCIAHVDRATESRDEIVWQAHGRHDLRLDDRGLQRLAHLDVVERRVGVVDIEHGEELVHAAWFADHDGGIGAHGSDVVDRRDLQPVEFAGLQRIGAGGLVRRC